jgi:hypothetical protein
MVSVEKNKVIAILTRRKPLRRDSPLIKAEDIHADSTDRMAPWQSDDVANLLSFPKTFDTNSQGQTQDSKKG